MKLWRFILSFIAFVFACIGLVVYFGLSLIFGKGVLRDQASRAQLKPKEKA